MYFHIGKHGPAVGDSRVEDFTVGHRDFGFARFPGQTNIGNLNLSDTGRLLQNLILHFLQRFFVSVNVLKSVNEVGYLCSLLKSMLSNIQKTVPCCYLPVLFHCFIL